MIRIETSAAAYEALVAGRSADSILEALPSPRGGFYLLLNKLTANNLRYARKPGEDYSATILRLNRADVAD